MKPGLPPHPEGSYPAKSPSRPRWLAAGRGWQVTLLLTLALGLAGSGAAWGDLDVRECIDFSSGGSWKLPANSGWKDVGTLTINVISAESNIVVQAGVQLQGGNTAGNLVEYDMTLDGAAAGDYFRRTPEYFPQTQIFRVFLQNVAVGQHSFTIRANNQSSSTVHYAMFWISPFLVDASEPFKRGLNTTTTSVGASYTTLVTSTLTPGMADAMLLGAYADILSGTANDLLEFQILNGARVVEDFLVGVPPTLSDGLHAAAIDSSPTGGVSNTYTLQAKNLSGHTTSIEVTSLFAQAFPSSLTVLHGSASNVAVAADASFHTVSTSGSIALGSGSSGTHGTNGWGFANVTYNGLYNGETDLEFLLSGQDDTVLFEVGELASHQDNGNTRFQNHMGDWEKLGLTVGHHYTIDLKAVSNVCTSTKTISFKQVDFSYLMVPDANNFLNPNSCTPSKNNCCAQNDPPCTVYTCAASGALTVESVGSITCPP
jgi:hypothetical protein